MSYLPVSLNVENKKILIVGGGNVAYQKAKNISPYARHVTVVAPDFKEELRQMRELNLICDVYKKEYLNDIFLVYACTDSKEVNEQISSDSEKIGVLCNRTDNADFSDFISSAIAENDSITVGINSKTRDPEKILAFKTELDDLLKEQELLEKQKKELKGKVFLVGFGPGNPDLLTKRGEKLLKQADIIFYDDLLASDALDKYTGQKEYVGKRRGNHSKEQSEINEILLNAAREGHMVVRLKGGDPFIFGRGGEEKSYLEERGIPVEIIPGITSAVAASAFSGIPLTHRGISSSVSFGTAHGKNSFCISETDTAVYYMGAQNLKDIARKYQDNDYSDDYPVGIIYNVSMPDQEVIYTTISDIAEGKVALKSPAISIFGHSVNIGEKKVLEKSKLV